MNANLSSTTATPFLKRGWRDEVSESKRAFCETFFWPPRLPARSLQRGATSALQIHRSVAVGLGFAISPVRRKHRLSRLFAARRDASASCWGFNRSAASVVPRPARRSWIPRSLLWLHLPPRRSSSASALSALRTVTCADARARGPTFRPHFLVFRINFVRDRWTHPTHRTSNAR